MPSAHARMTLIPKRTSRTNNPAADTSLGLLIGVIIFTTLIGLCRFTAAVELLGSLCAYKIARLFHHGLLRRLAARRQLIARPRIRALLQYTNAPTAIAGSAIVCIDG